MMGSLHRPVSPPHRTTSMKLHVRVKENRNMPKALRRPIRVERIVLGLMTKSFMWGMTIKIYQLSIFSSTQYGMYFFGWKFTPCIYSSSCNHVTVGIKIVDLTLGTWINYSHFWFLHLFNIAKSLPFSTVTKTLREKWKNLKKEMRKKMTEK